MTSLKFQHYIRMVRRPTFDSILQPRLVFGVQGTLPFTTLLKWKECNYVDVARISIDHLAKFVRLFSMFLLVNFAGIMRRDSVQPQQQQVEYSGNSPNEEDHALLLQPRKRILLRGKSGTRWTGVDLAQSPLYLPEPKWIPDEAVTQCHGCDRRFAFLRRKHHCRRCGHIFCGACCGVKSGLRRMGFVGDVRQCGRCTDASRSENAFFDTHLAALEQGGHFYVRRNGQSTDPRLSKTTFRVRMSCNHRWISFDACGSLPEVYTRDIARLQPIRTSDILATSFLYLPLEYYAGTMMVPGMLLTYRDSSAGSDKIGEMCLQASVLPDLDESRSWLVAMQQADLMLSQPLPNLPRSSSTVISFVSN